MSPTQKKALRALLETGTFPAGVKAPTILVLEREGMVGRLRTLVECRDAEGPYARESYVHVVTDKGRAALG